ncbi:MAG: type II toxin-antitoxin system RelE/ParE family toxin [Bauldia sp.]
MKEIVYLPQARKALLRHRAEAERIMAKIAAYARNPASQANNVKVLKGSTRILRLRIGAYRVLFSEDKTSITVIDIGPRGSIYE